MNEEELKNKFKSELIFKRFGVVREFRNNPPDMIVEKDGNYAAIEFKGSRYPSQYCKAIGQLLFARFKYNIKNLWLVLPKTPSLWSREWVKLLLSLGIDIFYFSDDKFINLTMES